MLLVLKNMVELSGDIVVFMSAYMVAPWVNFKDICMELVTELMRLNPNKRKYYQQGMRARKLIESTY